MKEHIKYNSQTAINFFNLIKDRGGLTDSEFELIKGVVKPHENVERLFDVMEVIYITADR